VRDRVARCRDIRIFNDKLKGNVMSENDVGTPVAKTHEWLAHHRLDLVAMLRKIDRGAALVGRVQIVREFLVWLRRGCPLMGTLPFQFLSAPTSAL
jgi:hypothetical protein